MNQELKGKVKIEARNRLSNYPYSRFLIPHSTFLIKEGGFYENYGANRNGDES